MSDTLITFLLHWGILALSLWVASHVFQGVSFESKSALAVSALLLGFANAVVRPLVILLTLPLTLVTFGLFLLAINAFMIQLVAWLVPGFKISGFWKALIVSIFVSIFSFLIGYFIPTGTPDFQPPSGNGIWL
jgi:putative membrane protein